MAKPTTTTTVFIFFFLLLATANSDDNTTSAIQEELSTMLQTLKSQGRTLFTNAIATSDLQYHLTTASPITYFTTSATTPPSPPPSPTSFTLFAPTDAPIFSLDMSLTAEAYVSTLKYHVIPGNRYTFADLQNLTSQFLETLLPYHSVLIGKVQNGSVSGLLVDGVRVIDPDLFVGSRFSVHGIDGILVTGINNQDYGAGEGSNVFSPAEAPGPATFGWNSPLGSPAPAQGPIFAGRVGGGKRNRRSGHRKGRVNKRRKGEPPVHKSHDL